MTSVDAIESNDTPDTPDFVFEATLQTTNGNDWTAFVRYDGDSNTLKAGARETGVQVEEVPADQVPNEHRVVTLAGSASAVQRAIGEYATRATQRREYTLGDLGITSRGW